MSFYKKNNWTRLNKKVFNVADHTFSSNGMIFNKKILKKMLYYINTELMNALKLIGILIVSNTILVSVESIIALKILKIDYSDCRIKLLKYRLV